MFLVFVAHLLCASDFSGCRVGKKVSLFASRKAADVARGAEVLSRGPALTPGHPRSSPLLPPAVTGQSRRRFSFSAGALAHLHPQARPRLSLGTGRRGGGVPPQRRRSRLSTERASLDCKQLPWALGAPSLLTAFTTSQHLTLCVR